jgi:acyl-CoA thioesterase II
MARALLRHALLMLAFFGLEPATEPGKWRFTVTADLLVGGSSLFGGAALGAVLSAMESTTGRRTLWATAQFISRAPAGRSVGISIRVAAAGRRITQASAIARCGDSEIVEVVGAFGERAASDEGFVFIHPPEVPPPLECPPQNRAPWWNPGALDRFEGRLAAGRQPEDLADEPTSERLVVWARPKPPVALAAGSLAVLGDLVSGAFSHALGRLTGAPSLDNTLRIVREAPNGWVLCELIVESAGVGPGIGTGQCRFWTESGQFLGVASQTALLREVRGGR